MFGGNRDNLVSSARRLQGSDTLALDSYLASDPIAFIYPLGWLRREGIVPRSRHLSFVYSGVFDRGQLLGATLTAGRVLVFVATNNTAIAEELAHFLHSQNEPFYVVVGPEPQVDAFWRVFEARGQITRLRQHQVVLLVQNPALARYCAKGLRQATQDDLEMLLQATLDMHAHETEEAPRRRDLPTFRRTIEYQIALKKVYVWTEDNPSTLRFKASVSAHCPEGAQIEGVWVPPHHRGQRYGLRGVSQLCQWLLTETETVSLYVNRANEAAVSLYRKLGFESVMGYETVFRQRERG